MAGGPLETVPFDAAVYLTDAEAQLELLTDALQSGDAGYIAAAIGTVAREAGVSSPPDRRSGFARPSPTARKRRSCRFARSPRSAPDTAG
jgi:hypothetical protein